MISGLRMLVGFLCGKGAVEGLLSKEEKEYCKSLWVPCKTSPFGTSSFTTWHGLRLGSRMCSPVAETHVILL